LLWGTLLWIVRLFEERVSWRGEEAKRVDYETVSLFNSSSAGVEFWSVRVAEEWFCALAVGFVRIGI